ncbi:MAG TPA: enolase C-terminal domain-like protein [Alphaproteobacteria bacterium]|nr:enolase C-terminal domain-like protein [Alphaproteobacteria bacterium]
MKITRIETIPAALPYAKPMRMAGQLLTMAEVAVVRIETDSPIVGWGEATAAPIFSGETVSSVMAAIAHLEPALIGTDPRDVVRLDRLIGSLLVGNSGARAALDMAFHDILGKSVGLPVHRLLGGRTRERIDCMCLLGAGQIERDLADAADRARDGYRLLKLKVAIQDLPDEVETVRRLREALGREVALAVDANQGWSADQAIAFARSTETAGLAFIEQPVAGDNLAQMARIAGTTTVTIAADEGIHGLADIIRHADAGAAQGAGLKVMKFGGLRQIIEAGRVCDFLGWTICVSGKLGETGISNAATLQVASAIGSLGWGLSLTNHYLADDLVRDPPRVVNGTIAPTEEPGLGITIDEKKLEKYAVNRNAGSEVSGSKLKQTEMAK